MDVISDHNELIRLCKEALRREVGQENTERFIDLLSTGSIEQHIIPPPPTLPTDPTPLRPAKAEQVFEHGQPATQPEKQYLLFSNGEQPPPMDAQPWTSPRGKALSAEQNDDHRTSLLADLADSRLGTIERKVGWILQQHPETRDSDTSLTIRFWTHFQAETLANAGIRDLDFLYDLDAIGSLTRSRRHIQNKLKVFQGTAFTRRKRGEVQSEIYEYLAAKRNDDAEIRFYLDETGTDAQRRYTGIGGLCVIDYRQFEMQLAALSTWRLNQGWVETIHFADLTSETTPRAIALLEQLHKRRAGLLFLGYSLESRSPTHADLSALLVQLVSDALARLQEHGCLGVPKALTIFKEAEEGFDNLHLSAFKQDLAYQLAKEFPDRVFLREVLPCPKGKHVLLECADLIAAGMQRRALYGGRNPKDVLAEAVINVTGFDDPKEQGALYRVFPAK